MCDDPTKGLPDDLASVLRDTSIIVSQDAAVFDAIARWRNAPSDTASITTPEASPDSALSVRLASRAREFDHTEGEESTARLLREAASLVSSLTRERDEAREVTRVDGFQVNRLVERAEAAEAQVAAQRAEIMERDEWMRHLAAITPHTQGCDEPNDPLCPACFAQSEVLRAAESQESWDRDVEARAERPMDLVNRNRELEAINAQMSRAEGPQRLAAAEAQVAVYRQALERGEANGETPSIRAWCSLTLSLAAAVVVGQPGESPADTGDDRG